MDPDVSERREPSKTKMTKMSSKIVKQKMDDSIVSRSRQTWLNDGRLEKST
jgi:hypothetical protein